ncbi:MAG: hypothetical protein IJU53_02170 [Thermoguttaceae bacterium]|nr:hypothetical protein [Thermoguttaceae bacterium]
MFFHSSRFFALWFCVFSSQYCGGFGGFCEIRSGSVNWPAVRQAIEDIGYNGFMTIEGGSVPIAKKSADLDLIIAGK